MDERHFSAVQRLVDEEPVADQRVRSMLLEGMWNPSMRKCGAAGR